MLKEITYSELTAQQQIVKTYEYDEYGNIKKSNVTAWNGNQFETRSTTTEYDVSGKFVSKTINPLGHSSLNEYDLYTGKLLTATDENGLKTRFEYDDYGRIKKQITPDKNWAVVDYKFSNINITDKFPHSYVYAIVKQTSVGERNVEYYDGLDRQIGGEKKGFNGTEIIQEKEFEPKSLLTRESRWHYWQNDPAVYTTYHYDTYGRQISITEPGNRTEAIAYSARQKVFTNAQGQTKTVKVDDKDQVIQVLDDNNKSLTYEYNAAGNLLKITDPKGNTITNEYDDRGNKISMSDPDLGTYTYAYNAFGELIKQTDPAAKVTTLVYDILGRLLTRTEPEGVTTWTYDAGAKAIGKLTSVVNYDSSSESYLYDTLGRVVQTTRTITGKTFVVRNSYDSLGRLDTLVYPSGLKIRHKYNHYGFLSEVRKAAAGDFLYWQASKVNAVGLLEEQMQGTQVTSKFNYNPETLFLDSLRSENGVRFFNSWKFKYSSLGNLLERTNASIGKTETFQYDNLNRVTNATIIGGSTIVTQYDELGNIVLKSDVGI